MCANRLLYLAALVLSAVFYAYYTSWVSWYLLLLMLCLPVFSLLCSLPALLSTRIEADIPAFQARGRSAVLSITLRCKGQFTAPRCRLVLEETDCLTGGRRCERLELFHGSLWQDALPTAHCGAFSYRLQRGKIYDYLGLFSFRIQLPQELFFTVEPVPVPMDPVPELDMSGTPAYKPKPGGGFSEVHELREYRPGDPLRDIHWKMSAKAGTPIVREAQEAERSRVLISLDLPLSRSELDRTLDQLIWLSASLLEHGLPHSICYTDAESLALRLSDIQTPNDLKTLTRTLLRQKLPESAHSLARRAFPQAGLRFHLGTVGGEVHTS